MTTYPLITSTPERLCLDSDKVPSWARGSEAIERDGYSYECFELIRDSITIGWMYDDGSGYLFTEDEPDKIVEAIQDELSNA